MSFSGHHRSILMTMCFENF